MVTGVKLGHWARSVIALLLSTADRMLGRGCRLAGCVAGVTQAVYVERRKHHPWQDKGSTGVKKASARQQRVGFEGQQLNSSRHEMHASMQQTFNQLSSDLAQALSRNAELEAQVATLTAALRQPASPGSETVPNGPATDTEPAQQAAPIAAQPDVLVDGGHPTVALQLDPPTPCTPLNCLAQSKSFTTSLPGAASGPGLTFLIAAFPGGSSNSPSSSPSMAAETSSASYVSSRFKANVDGLHEDPSSSAVDTPEVVQPQAAAGPSSSPAAAPGDVPAADSSVNMASAAEGPPAAQPSVSFAEEKQGGPLDTAVRPAHPPLSPPLLASAQTVPGCKGAHGSLGSAMPAARGLLSFFGRGRRFLSPGAALAAMFALPKKVAGSFKTRLQGIAYGVAKKTLPGALFNFLTFFGQGRRFLSPGAALAAISATLNKVAGRLKTRLYDIAYGVAKKTLPAAVFIQLELLVARSARQALAAEAQAMPHAQRRLHKRARRKLAEAHAAWNDLERAIKLLDEGIRLKAPGDVVNCLLYKDRAWCQWERKCGMHALLDAITAQKFSCPEAGMWQPVFVCGSAWELMGIYSSAVKDFSLARRKGFYLPPGSFKRLKALEDRVSHQHVLGFTPGGSETVNSLSRRLLARLHPDKAKSQCVPEALRQRLYHMVQEAKDALLSDVPMTSDVPTGPHSAIGCWELCGVLLLLWCLISMVLPGLLLWLFHVDY